LFNRSELPITAEFLGGNFFTGTVFIGGFFKGDVFAVDFFEGNFFVRESTSFVVVMPMRPFLGASKNIGTTTM